MIFGRVARSRRTLKPLRDGAASESHTVTVS